MLSVMYLNDDYKTAKIGDRIIARAIAGFCGFWLGGFFGILVYEFTDNNYGLAWFFALALGVFAFFAPSKSREIWSAFWEELLGLLSSKK